MNDPLIARFAAACGATGPLDLCIGLADGGVLAEGSVAQPFTLVGRDDSCDVTLNDPDVHPRHAWFQVLGGRVFALDLGGRGGLVWPCGMSGPGWLDAGVPVRVGPFRLHLRAPATAAPPPDPAASPLHADAAIARGRPVHLDFRNGKRAKDRWAVNRAITLVGRAEGCKIHLHADDIARYHCGLVHTPAGLWVVDLSGRGVVVDGERMRVAPLGHGAELKVGRFVIRCDDPPRDAPPAGAPTRVATDRPASPEDEVSIGGLLRPDGRSTDLPSSHIMRDPFRATAVPGPPSAPIFVSGAGATPPAIPLAGPGLRPAPASPPANDMLGPLLRQLGEIHRQVFEQVGQSLVLLARLCGRGTEARAAPLRAELARLQELNRDLQQLQQEVTLLALAHAPAPPARPPADRPGASERTPPPAAAARGAATGEAIRDWVQERIGGLQRERQCRWDALVGLLGDDE